MSNDFPGGGGRAGDFNKKKYTNNVRYPKIAVFRTRIDGPVDCNSLSFVRNERAPSRNSHRRDRRLRQCDREFRAHFRLVRGRYGPCESASAGYMMPSLPSATGRRVWRRSDWTGRPPVVRRHRVTTNNRVCVWKG